MKSCPVCLQTHECKVEKEYGYRSAPLLIDEHTLAREPTQDVVQRVPFKIAYPKVYKTISTFGLVLGRSAVGSLVLSLVLAIGWVLTVGIYRMGMFLGNDLLNWHIKDIERGPGGWLMGAGVIIIPLIIYWTGKETLAKREK